MTSKRCPSCRHIKSLEDFHRNKSSSDGHAHECKACRNRGYALASDEARIRKGDLRSIRENGHHGPHRDKKRCLVCHRYLLIRAFRPHRFSPDGENECIECARIAPWKRAVLRLARRELLDHLAVYDENMPIAAGLRG